MTTDTKRHQNFPALTKRDSARDAANAGVISANASRVAVRVIHTDEDLMIARSVCRAPGLGMAGEKRNSDHTMKNSSRLDPFSAHAPHSEAASARAI